MAVHLVLECGGCNAAATTERLRKEFHGINGRPWGFGVGKVNDVEELTPPGWVMFDPWTYCTYCPTCWAEIQCPLLKDAS